MIYLGADNMNINKHIADINDKFPNKVSKLTANNKTFYLKRNIEKKLFTKKIMNSIQIFLADILQVKVLAPTANTTELSTHESDKILALRKSGLKVPNIHYSSPEYFIMEDCGDRLKDILKMKGANKNLLLQKAIKNLALLHNAGFAHGGSQIRNFTYKDGEVHMIDFEEKVRGRHLSAIQFRDILVFLISVASLRSKDINYSSILETYEKHSHSNKDALEKIIKISNRFNFIGKLSKSKYSKLLGKDILFISLLISELSSISSLYSVDKKLAPRNLLKI